MGRCWSLNANLGDLRLSGLSKASLRPASGQPQASLRPASGQPQASLRPA